MKNFMAIVFIGLAATAMADVHSIPVPTSAVTNQVYSGVTLQRFTLSIPEGIDIETFLSGMLTVSASLDAPEAGLAEVSVAQWTNDAPAVPSGKELPVSNLVFGSEVASVTLDLTPILRDALADELTEVSLVVGTLPESELSSCTILPIDNENGLWGTIELSNR
jgi:hypothetical protein